MQNARNLRVYAEARKVAGLAYALTRTFPTDERFGMTSQMRRAAVSIGANIAEGCGRQGNRALIAFLHNALGSASELEFELQVSTDVGLCSPADGLALHESVLTVKAMLARLIAALRARPDTTR